MPAKPSQFLALLRGINVGGKNIIAKDDLRGCFEDLGFTDVRTYIQSGNILFRSAESNVRKLIATVEAGLSDRFNYDAQAIVISHRRYKSAVAAAPADWGEDAARKHNALFTLSTTTPAKVLAQVPEVKADLETVTAGPGVIFWSYSKKQQHKTTIMQLSKTKAYQQVTVRNHNTVYRLLELMDAG